MQKRNVRAALLAGVAFLVFTGVGSAASAAPPAPSQWDGFYASVSAGAAWLHGDTTQTFGLNNATSITDFNGFNLSGGATNSQTTTSAENDFTSASGRNPGAVFTFTMGYNAVWNRYLAGIQSEVSYNQGGTRMVGTFTDRFASTTVTTVPTGVPPGNAGSVNSGAIEIQLTSRWTISEMARLGYLVTSDCLLYGLVGWSMSGFEL
jgi:opacity protein-like surface antigen